MGAHSLLIRDPDLGRRLKHSGDNTNETGTGTKLEHLLASELAGVDRMAVCNVAGQDLSVRDLRCHTERCLPSVCAWQSRPSLRARDSVQSAARRGAQTIRTSSRNRGSAPAACAECVTHLTSGPGDAAAPRSGVDLELHVLHARDGEGGLGVLLRRALAGRGNVLEAGEGDLGVGRGDGGCRARTFSRYRCCRHDVRCQ